MAYKSTNPTKPRASKLGPYCLSKKRWTAKVSQLTGWGNFKNTISFLVRAVYKIARNETGRRGSPSPTQKNNIRSYRDSNFWVLDFWILCYWNRVSHLRSPETSLNGQNPMWSGASVSILWAVCYLVAGNLTTNYTIEPRSGVISTKCVIFHNNPDMHRRAHEVEQN